MPVLIDNPYYNRFRNYYRKIRPKIEDRQTSAYFMLILSFFALSFFGIFAIRPTLQTITELQKETSDSQDVLKKLQEKKKNLLALQTQYKMLETDIPIVYAALPNQIEAPSFLLKVKTLASLNSLSIKSLQAAKSPLSRDKTNLSPVFSTFNLTLSGSYKNINNFLVGLATLDRIATFDNIEILRGTTTQNEDLTLQLTGKIYALFD